MNLLCSILTLKSCLNLFFRIFILQKRPYCGALIGENWLFLGNIFAMLYSRMIRMSHSLLEIKTPPGFINEMNRPVIIQQVVLGTLKKNIATVTVRVVVASCTLSCNEILGWEGVGNRQLLCFFKA
jgi:hypothetical protein